MAKKEAATNGDDVGDSLFFRHSDILPVPYENGEKIIFHL